jgi:hypothetical protein
MLVFWYYSSGGLRRSLPWPVIIACLSINFTSGISKNKPTMASPLGHVLFLESLSPAVFGNNPNVHPQVSEYTSQPLHPWGAVQQWKRKEYQQMMHDMDDKTLK